MWCVQTGGTRQRQVGILLDIISHRSDRHFKAFLRALVEVDEEDFAKALDEDIANHFISQRNVRREDMEGMRLILTELLLITLHTADSFQSLYCA